MKLNKSLRRSNIWNVFSQIDEIFAICDICKQKLSFKSSISNLRKHLARKHPDFSFPWSQESSKQEEEQSESYEITSMEDAKINSEEDIKPRSASPKEVANISRKKRVKTENQSDTVSVVQTSLKHFQPSNLDDEYEVTGKKFAFDLRNLSYEQKVTAEKLINDVIYYGKLGKLNENSAVNVNTLPSQNDPSVNSVTENPNYK